VIKKATIILGAAALALGMMQIPAFSHGGHGGGGHGGGGHGGGGHGGGYHGGGHHGGGHHGGHYHGHYHGHTTVVINGDDDHNDHAGGKAFVGALAGAAVGTAIANSNNPAND
jgi:hypothetical protein